MSLHVKKGDTVEIISGAHKGATGKALRVFPKEGKVLIQGHNLARKHVRRSRQNPQGGQITVEQPIDISNVLPVSSKSNKGVRVRHKIESDGAKKRVGIDGTEIGLTKRGKKD
ncbi:MAG: 50S ribosomal protein L24 [Sedimentisphaerales bacterium]|nr:50S ribosomal protein L24 [Sedimentisphaerales bacterium]